MDAHVRACVCSNHFRTCVCVCEHPSSLLSSLSACTLGSSGTQKHGSSTLLWQPAMRNEPTSSGLGLCNNEQRRRHSGKELDVIATTTPSHTLQFAHANEPFDSTSRIRCCCRSVCVKCDILPHGTVNTELDRTPNTRRFSSTLRFASVNVSACWPANHHNEPGARRSHFDSPSPVTSSGCV